MKLLQMELTNFLSYRHGVVTFEGLDYCAIIGPNGAGKSTIPQAVAWAFYGMARVSGDSDSVVHDEAETAHVRLDLEDNGGTRWRIERTRYWQKKGEVRLYCDKNGTWEQHGDHLNKTAQLQINEIVGMDEDAFFSLVVMDQSSTAGGTRFTRADSKQRRAILMGLLPEMQVWYDIEADAQSSLRDVRDDLKADRTRLESTVERLSRTTERVADLHRITSQHDEVGLREREEVLDKQVEDVSNRISRMTSDRRALESEIDAARSGHRARLAEARGALESAVAAERRHTDLDRAVQARSRRIESLQGEALSADDSATQAEAGLAAVESGRAVLDAALERIDTALHEAVGKRAECKGALQDVMKQRDGLKAQDPGEGSCWVCEARLTPEHYQELLTGLDRNQQELQEQLREREGVIETLNAKRRAQVESITDHDKECQRARNKVQTWRGEARNARQQLEDLEDQQDRDLQALEQMDSAIALEVAVERAQETLHGIESEDPVSDALTERLSEMADTTIVQDLTRRLGDAKRERQELGARLRELGQALGSLKEAESAVTDLNSERDALTQSIKDLEQRETRLAWLYGACGAKGIPSMLLDSILGAVEDAQNAILADLPGSEALRVEFRQTKELKSRDGQKGVLDIIVHTGDGYERAIESFSFGERVRLTISNLFALVQVFNARTNGLVSTLMLDEPLGPLDEDSVPAFVDVLRSAMNNGIVESIYVVTHDQRVIEALPQRLVVTRGEDGGSRVDLDA